jgi:hypothetical protein
MTSISNTKKSSLTSTEYNFSLLADPNKIKNIDKTIMVKTFKNSNETESDKSNLYDIQDPESDIKFNNKKDNSHKSSRSSKSSVSSHSSRSSNRNARYNSIRESFNHKDNEINYNKYNDNNSDSYHEKEQYRQPKEHFTAVKEPVKEHFKEVKEHFKEVKEPAKKTFVQYFNENDDYDKCDDMTKKVKRMEKFSQLMYIKSNNCQLSKTYTIDSDYWEMCAEIKFHTDIKNREHGVELAKDFLVYSCTAVEFMNDRFDPFGVNLKGWSDHVKLTKNNYNDVLAELYEKYKGSGKKVEPEVKLMFMIMISAGSFHASKTIAKIPGLEEIIKNNPELLANIESTINKKINGPPPKSAEDIKKETEFKLYQQMMAERSQKQETQQMQQPQMQQPQMQQSQMQQSQMQQSQMQQSQMQQSHMQQPQMQQSQMQQSHMQQPQMHQFNGLNTSINVTPINTPIDQITLNQQKILEQQIKSSNPQNKNLQSILTKVNSTLNLNEIKTTIPLDDTDIFSVSSIKPNTRMEVTETLMSNSDTQSSMNSSDIKISQNRKKRITIASN